MAAELHPDLTQALWTATERARRFARGEDPSAVIEALALVLVVDLHGALPFGLGTAALRGTASGAIAQAKAEALDDEDLELAVSLAEAGLAVLEGREPRPGAGDALHPPPGRLLDMLRGEPDPLSAAAAAAHVRGCGACRAAFCVLVESAPAPFALAASDAMPMRTPSDGVLVARLDEPDVEARLFVEPDARRLAVYASDPAPLRLTAEGVVTEQMLGGYWIGRVSSEARVLEATLHVAERAVPWRVQLPE